jgi:hypothetical protein
MKNLSKILMAFFLGFLPMVSFAQFENPEDSIKTYDVYLDDVMTTMGRQYRANGKNITKEQYEYFKSYWEASKQCTPCILKTYDEKDILKYEVFCFLDCFLGSYKEYYPDGKVKLQGQFLGGETATAQKQYANRQCNIRTGEWIYFAPNGSKTLIENYVNGTLVSSVVPKEPTPASNNGESKKSVFQKVKDKIKPDEN